jgi:hypothetical protein
MNENNICVLSKDETLVLDPICLFLGSADEQPLPLRVVGLGIGVIQFEFGIRGFIRWRYQQLKA